MRPIARLALAFALLLGATSAQAADYTATAADAAKAAYMAAKQPGDTITVSGVLTPAWAGVKFAAPGVRVIAAPGAQLAGWGILKDVQGVTLSGFKVTTAQTANAALIGLGGGTTERVVLEDTEFVGLAAVSGGNGGGVIGSGITIRRAKVHALGGGFSIQGGANIVFEDVECFDVWMDCFAISGGSNITIRRLFAHDLPGSGLHHDLVQSLDGVDGLTVEGLVYVRGSGVSTQGLFFSAPTKKYTNITIRGNALYGSAGEGLHLTGIASGVVEDNYVAGDGLVSDGMIQTPWLKTSGMTGGIVRNNRAGAFVLVPTSPDNVNNVVVKNGDRAAFDAFLHRNDAPAAKPAPPDPRDLQIATLNGQVAKLQADLAAAGDALTSAQQQGQALTAANADLSSQLATASAARDTLAAKIAAALAALN